MIPKLILAAGLLIASAFASANTYTDVWFDPAESGWGVFVRQSNNFQFLAFFIYGPDGQPTWYTAQLTGDGSGLNYSGPLYATTGTYFGSPWQGVAVAQVGTASFQGSPVADDYFHATLTYTVNGVTVTKAIVRQTLTAFAMSGSYSGSVVGTVSGCANAANNNAAVSGRFNLVVAQVADTSATLTFTLRRPQHDLQRHGLHAERAADAHRRALRDLQCAVQLHDAWLQSGKHRVGEPELARSDGSGNRGQVVGDNQRRLLAGVPLLIGVVLA